MIFGIFVRWQNASCGAYKNMITPMDYFYIYSQNTTDSDPVKISQKKKTLCVLNPFRCWDRRKLACKCSLSPFK